MVLKGRMSFSFSSFSLSSLFDLSGDYQFIIFLEDCFFRTEARIIYEKQEKIFAICCIITYC